LLSEAAHAAYRTGDFVLARRLAEAAHKSEAVEGSLLLGQILHETGEHLAAEEINAAFAPGEFGEDLVERATVQRAVNLFFGLGRGDDALRTLADAPGALRYNRAWFLLNMGRLDEAQAIAGREGDGASFRVTSAWIAALAGRPAEALDLLGEDAPGDISPVPGRFRDFPDLPRSLALLELGRLHDALELARRGHEASIDQHPDFIRCWWLFLLGRISTDMGRLRSAASYFQQGAVLQEGLHQPGLMSWYLGGWAYALAQSGDASDVDHLLARSEGIGDRDERLFTHVATAAHAWRRGRQGGSASAIDSLIAAGDAEAGNGSHAAARRLWFDAIRLGGFGVVADRLDDTSTRLDVARRGVALGRRSGDPEMVEESATLLDQSGASLWAAEAWTAASSLWARRGEGRRETAAVRAADAARISCEDPDTAGLVVERGVVPLTDREREVVNLAARGVPSKEIADALFISVRTVNNQIQRAYVKLGVSSRSDAALALGIDVSE
jgi:DNA-binding CsgD family transcriptional regulator